MDNSTYTSINATETFSNHDDMTQVSDSRCLSHPVDYYFNSSSPGWDIYIDLLYVSIACGIIASFLSFYLAVSNKSSISDFSYFNYQYKNFKMVVPLLIPSFIFLNFHITNHIFHFDGNSLNHYLKKYKHWCNYTKPVFQRNIVRILM